MNGRVCGGHDDQWGDGGKLVGDLTKHRDILLQVIHNLVCGACLQTLVVVNYKCSESGGN